MCAAMSSTRTVVVQNFDELLLQSIDEAFSDLLGPSLNGALFHYLESKFFISRESIPSRLQDFVLAVSEIFGVLGALVFARAVAKRFYTKLGLEFTKEPRYTLLDYVDKAKMSLPSD
jgi:hypothetical protein